jgi:deoxyribose-phosphate aldolase
VDRPTLASYLDHTLLRPEATDADVAALCREATELGVAAVCVSPSRLPIAPALLGSGIAVASV